MNSFLRFRIAAACCPVRQLRRERIRFRVRDIQRKLHSSGSLLLHFWMPRVQDFAASFMYFICLFPIRLPPASPSAGGRAPAPGAAAVPLAARRLPPGGRRSGPWGRRHWHVSGCLGAGGRRAGGRAAGRPRGGRGRRRVGWVRAGGQAGGRVTTERRLGA